MAGLKRIHVIAVLVGAAGVLLAAGFTAYFLLYGRAGRQSHEAFLSPNTAARVMFQPYRVQDYISDLAPDATRFINKIPRVTTLQKRSYRVDWMHNLPYEFTLLFRQGAPDLLDVTLFVNETPGMESFVSELNRSAFWHMLRGLRWRPPRLQQREGNAYATDGAWRVAVWAQEQAAAHWPSYRPVSPPQLEGGHFLEAAADNRMGVLQEMHGAVMAGWGQPGGEGLHQSLTDAWPMVQRARLTADLDGPDRLTFRGEAIATDGVDQAYLADTVAYLAETIDAGLRAWRGLRLQGQVQWTSDRTLEAVYTLTEFEPPLRRALNPRY